MKRLLLLLALPTTGCVWELRPSCPVVCPPADCARPCDQGYAMRPVMPPPPAVTLEAPRVEPAADDPPAPAYPAPLSSAAGPRPRETTRWVPVRVD